MINVDTLYSRIKDLARKDKSGYLTNDEFNRNLVNAQTAIYEYYFSIFEQTQVVPDRMAPFVVQGSFALPASGLVALPSLFKHTLRVNFIKVTNVAGGAPVTSKIEALPIEATEIDLTLSSPVRGPSVANRNIYYRVAGTNLQVFNGGIHGGVEFEYLRQPETPERAVTLDTDNDEESYDSANSTQLEWDSHVEPHFVDVLLYYYGLPTRQSEIIQWLSSSAVTKQVREQ